MPYFAGQYVKNHLVAASSPLTESVWRVRACEEAGFGAAILKSCDPVSRQLPAYNRRVLYADGGYYADGSYPGEIATLAQGLALYRAVHPSKMVIIPSVSCLSMSADEWLRGCAPFADQGAGLIQLDFFYVFSVICLDSRRLDEFSALLASLKKMLDGVELMPKLSAFIAPDDVCAAIRDAGIGCVSLLDSIRREPPESSVMHPGSTSFFGNFMLPTTKKYLLSAVSHGLSVCAGGGVSSAEDVADLMSIGADLVQVASIALTKGYMAIPALLGKRGCIHVTHCPWCDVENGASCSNCGGCNILIRPTANLG